MLKRLVTVAAVLIALTGTALATPSRDASTPTQQHKTTALTETIVTPNCNQSATTITIVCANWAGVSNTFGATPVSACGSTAFTQVPNGLLATTSRLFGCYYAFCGASVSQTLTITATLTGANAEEAFCIDGVNTSTPFDSANMGIPVTNSATPHTTSLITGGPTVSNDLYAAALLAAAAAQTYSVDANVTLGVGYTNWAEAASSSSDVSTALSPTSGVSIVASSATISANDPGAAFAILLKPAAPTPTPTPTPTATPTAATPTATPTPIYHVL